MKRGPDEVRERKKKSTQYLTVTLEATRNGGDMRANRVSDILSKSETTTRNTIKKGKRRRE